MTVVMDMSRMAVGGQTFALHGSIENNKVTSRSSMSPHSSDIPRWRIGDAADVTAGTKHWVRFKFELDVAQFLMPLQIGALGQSDWQLVLLADQEISLETTK